MAGAGYKLFATGDVLTAAQVNTYLNEQTVMVFADSAARTTALSGVLAEGMVSYLQDTNAVEVYNGSAWVGVSGAGDVTEVQAGTGISVASGTGPIPVVTNTMATAIDAEGDLIIGDAADAFQRLAIGSNTHVLTVDTSVDGKIKWAAPAGGGKVLQVVFGSTAQEVTSASSTFADTGLTATITPTSATSKILVLVSQNGTYSNNSSVGNALGLRLMRGATDICVFADGLSYAVTSGGAAVGSITAASVCYLDEPATTSATTYKTQFKSMSAAATVHVQANFTGIGSLINNSTITLLEIGA
jgi:hypothetical protein